MGQEASCVSWRGLNRLFWIKTPITSFPIIMGLSTGEMAADIFDDHYTKHHIHCSEIFVINDELWMMMIARYER